LLFAGTVAVWLASNVFHAHTAGLTGRAAEIFAEHELLADYTWRLALAALASKALSHFVWKQKLWSELVVAALLVACSITVSIAGHHGAQLVYLEGVGPQGRHLESHDHE
jgi:hypothetical protein